MPPSRKLFDAVEENSFENLRPLDLFNAIENGNEGSVQAFVKSASAVEVNWQNRVRIVACNVLYYRCTYQWHF